MASAGTGVQPQTVAPAAIETRPQAPPARLYYLDYLRAGVVALVMLHHTAITYGGSGSWYYADASTSKYVQALLTWLTGYDQAWFMAFLFFLSGYLSLPSYTRKGAGPYLVDRLRRFGIPLVVYFFGISAVVTWLTVIAGPGPHPSLLAYWQSQYLTFRIMDTGPLWFVWALLLMDVALVLWAGRRSGTELAGRRETATFPSRRRLVVFAIGIGLAAFVVRLVIPVGATVLWGLQLGYFPSYVAMFVLGLWAWHGRWLDAIPDSAFRFARTCAIVGALTFPVLLVLGVALPGGAAAFAGGLHVQALAYALWEPWVLVGVSICLLHWGRRRLNAPSPRWQGWASASYMAYILQPLALVPIAILFTGVGLPALVKFVVVGALTIVCAYGLARLVRLVPPVRTAIG